jgi:hypothetical protein
MVFLVIYCSQATQVGDIWQKNYPYQIDASFNRYGDRGCPALRQAGLGWFSRQTVKSLEDNPCVGSPQLKKIPPPRHSKSACGMPPTNCAP